MDDPGGGGGGSWGSSFGPPPIFRRKNLSRYPPPPPPDPQLSVIIEAPLRDVRGLSHIHVHVVSSLTRGVIKNILYSLAQTFKGTAYVANLSTSILALNFVMKYRVVNPANII